MTAHHQTLLAKLAPKFGPQTENLAVDALGHILSGSKAARRALENDCGRRRGRGRDRPGPYPGDRYRGRATGSRRRRSE